MEIKIAFKAAKFILTPSGLKIIGKRVMKELAWGNKALRKELAGVNSKLAQSIDDISPNEDYKIYEAVYDFGNEIIKDGRLFIPSKNGKLVPLNSAEVSSTLQEQLGYNLGTNPVSVILSGSAEIFMAINSHTIPLYGLIPPGKILSTWKVLSTFPSMGPAFLWDMTAGARSCFMLSKISKEIAYNKLVKEFGLIADKPSGILDHWKIFKEIANHPSLGKPWKTKILFFSKKWFDHIHDKAFLPFKNCLFDAAWEGSNFWRHQFIWNLAFSLIEKKLNLKTPPYIEKNIKHLLSVGVGALPAYAPSIDDIAGPMERLKQVFSQVYGLSYQPIIMQPCHFSMHEDRSVYYSLQYPNTIEFSIKSRADSSKVTDLVQTKNLLNKHLSNLITNDLHIESTPFYDLPSLVEYSYFHTEYASYQGIRNPKEIYLEDKYFQIPIDQGQLFPYSSAFLRGCVRVSKKKNKGS